MPILVVDDFPLVAAMIAALLRGAGLGDVEIAHSGREASEKLGRRPYDLVISDLKMPEMSGVDLFLAIAGSDLAAKPRFKIVTGDKDPANLADLRGSGVDAVLEKPLTSAGLRAAIEAIFSGSPARAA